MGCSIYSPCELTHPSLTQIDLQGLPRSLSHPWAGVEGQNSEPRKSVKKEFDTEVGQPSTSVHFQLLQKVATLGDAQTTEAKVSDCCSGQTQTGEPWTAYGKCLHSWVREPGTAAQVKVQEGGREQGGNLVTHGTAAVSQVEDREMTAVFKQCGKLVVRSDHLFVLLWLVPWLVQVQLGQPLAGNHGQHMLPSDTAVAQIDVFHFPAWTICLRHN